MSKEKNIRLLTSNNQTVIEEKNCEIEHINNGIYDIFKREKGNRKLLMRIHKGDDMCLIIEEII